MWKCYLIALIPCIIGAILSLRHKKIHWVEWVGGSAAAFATAGLFHVIAVQGMTHDIETWSGQIASGRHEAAWTEYWEEAIYRTETYYAGTGKNRTRHTRRVFSHYEPRTTHHSDQYTLHSNIDQSISVSRDLYYQTAKNFGNLETVRGDRSTMKHASRMISGDPNDYVTRPVNGFILPVTDTRSWENRVKASPSVFSFQKVPETMTNLYEWPETHNEFQSGRLLGPAANKISIFEWDRMNARLGPIKGVNVILIDFGTQPSNVADWQRAKWFGGKKNDIVLCRGDGWARVFGWTESEYCKRNLETILLENQLSDSLIPLIEEEIRSRYMLKDWSKFDYLSVEPPTWAYIVLLIVMAAVQGGLYAFFLQNDLDFNTPLR